LKVSNDIIKARAKRRLLTWQEKIILRNKLL